MHLETNLVVIEKQTSWGSSLSCAIGADAQVYQWQGSLHNRPDAWHSALTLSFDPEALRCCPFLCNPPSFVDCGNEPDSFA